MSADKGSVTKEYGEGKCAMSAREPCFIALHWRSVASRLHGIFRAQPRKRQGDNEGGTKKAG